jgi:hypothetical protein
MAPSLLSHSGMILMQTPDGRVCEYRLQNTPYGLRLERSQCASYDLLTMVKEGGWRVFRADPCDRHLLQRAGVPVPLSVAVSPDRSGLRLPA